MKTTTSLIEALESRIAPATLTGKTLTYIDIGGDEVVINFTTKGTLSDANFVFDTAFDSSGPQQLQLIDLASDPKFDGTSIKMTITGGSGDGAADIGMIDATGRDLGTVSLLGDLGKILAGDDDANPGLKNLLVKSVGAHGTTTQQAGGNLASKIIGSVSKLNVAGDWDGASLEVANGAKAKGNLGKLLIDGSIIGGSAAISGQIHVFGKTGSVTITGSIIGGSGSESGSFLGANGLGSLTVGGNVEGKTGDYSGWVDVIGTIKKVSIGGSLKGGMNENAGLIGASKIGVVNVGGNIEGGSAVNSGQIYSGGSTESVTVDGGIKGGDGLYSGYIDVEGTLGKAMLGANLEGGNGQESGVIFADGGMKKIIVGGSIMSGAGSLSGAIDSNRAIGSLAVASSIIGTEASPVSVTAIGAPVKSSAKSNVAIGKITVGGNVTFALIRAGYNDNSPENPDVQIGSVSVGGNLIASSIVAGIEDFSGDGFGNGDDFVIGGGGGKVVSSIASIIVGGTVDGAVGGAGHFGITAEQVKKLVIGDQSIALTKGKHNDVLFDIPGVTTGNFTVNEVLIVS